MTELNPPCLSQNICFYCELQLRQVFYEFMRHVPVGQFPLIVELRYTQQPADRYSIGWVIALRRGTLENKKGVSF